MNDITCASCGKPVEDYRHFCDACLEAEKARQVQALEPDQESQDPTVVCAKFLETQMAEEPLEPDAHAESDWEADFQETHDPDAPHDTEGLE